MTVELDKLDIHNRQQLSALMDGELSPDEARFLLRRLQHDDELGSAWERWQLCGDVLRGQAQAPAPAGFAERIAQAVAAESHRHAANDTSAAAPRARLMRWGGGALAASVALMAFLIARPQLNQDTAPTAAPSIAATAPVPAVDEGTAADAGGTLADAGNAEVLASAAGAAVVASVPRREANARRSATRTQQAARSAMARAAREPQRAVANAAPIAAPVTAVASNSGSPTLATARANNPFSSSPVNAPQSRPWPRSTLPYASNAAGSLTTGYSSDSATRTFYPFDPAQSAPAAQP